MLNMSSCIVAQPSTTQYKHVYYDHVVSGVITAKGYVTDGYNSFHIIGEIPKNIYWELCPVGNEIYIYNKSLTYKRIYKSNKRWIFYNKHRHHHVQTPRYPHHQQKYNRNHYKNRH